MRPLREFEDFFDEGIVRDYKPDFSRAKSLRKESEEAYDFLKNIVESIGINDKNSNTIIKIGYDIIMELIRSKMYERGFKASGQGAHEAEVSFLRNLGFGEKEVYFCDQLRYFRNRIMYNGKSFGKDYAAKVISFTQKFINNIKI
ncbi:MAG: hypothetical protein ACQEP1_05500 [Nanobdellota archaeon]